MAKKQFKAESKRLLDLMIHSIYTHKEIFLRELISNASDAVDKLAYTALTDDKVGLNRKDFKIVLSPDKAARTLTLSDNGIGMSKEDLEQNLGTIAKSGSLQFKKELDEKADVDIIGQFGVGFYSAFMVADKVTVTSKAYGADEAFCWTSDGVDGYTVEPCRKDTVGTDIVLYLKPDGEEDDYSHFLSQDTLEGLVKKYSDYVHYPIVMDMERSRMKEKPADAGEDYKPEYETYTENTTLNSMVPLWQRQKSKVKPEEYNDFYKEKFGDWEDPLCVIHTAAEGTVSYKSLLYIPAKAPYDFYSRDYEKGLQLYSSGVLVMEKCGDLLPDHFRFVRGVVDSQDFSLNLSREVLQHTRGLKIIETALEKKIKSELLKLQTEDRAKYETFFAAFGTQLKYGIVGEYGAHKELLRDLLLFHSSKDGGLTTLAEYRSRMPESQQFIYYVRAENVQKAAALPQTERILDGGFEVLYLTEDVDEFVMQILEEQDGKKLKSVADEDALPQTEDDQKKTEEQTAENKDVLDFVKETLGDRIKECRISRILKSAPVCMTADGPMTLEMEKYFQKTEGNVPMKAERILELNPNDRAFFALRDAVSSDKERAAQYAELLYAQALLIADLPLPDPAEYTKLVCSLMG
ncbi:MAG: molecular chaperone HtpG [Oscillospiraceae bacterium]